MASGGFFSRMGASRGKFDGGSTFKVQSSIPLHHPPRDAGEQTGGGWNGLNDWNYWNEYTGL